MDKVKVWADPEYKIYDKFGIGQLPWSGLFSTAMITELRSLASQGIKNTKMEKGPIDGRIQVCGICSPSDLLMSC